MKVEHSGAVRTLTLDSPHNRNALSSALLDELADGFRDATSDDSVRAIVLTGSGTVFCSGADLSERHAAITSRMPEILTTISNSRVPVIARVNGHVRAGGLGLVAISDMAAASDGCSFAFSEVRVGVAPAMIMMPALRVMDRRFLSRMMLTGETFDTSEAAAFGLLTAVVQDESALNSWVDTALSSVLRSAPGAVAVTKALLAALPERTWSEGLTDAQARSAELFAGAEAAEGMEAFLRKRKPSWDVTGS